MDKQFKHIMIDAETLSTKRNAVIPSIALVKFDPATGETGERLHVVFDVQEQVDNGYHVSASTLAFWLKQDSPARRYLADILDKKDPHVVTRTQGMTHVRNFIRDARNATVWGNGISFDLGLLIEQFEAEGLPWAFWKERDVRTIVELCYMFNMPNYKNDIPMAGTAHHPVDDCLHQIAYTSRIIQHLAIPFDANRPVADRENERRAEGRPPALGMQYDKPRRKKAMVNVIRALHDAKSYGSQEYRVKVDDSIKAAGIDPKADDVLSTFGAMPTDTLDTLSEQLMHLSLDVAFAKVTDAARLQADSGLREDIQKLATQAYRMDLTPTVDSLLVKMGLPLKRDISAALKDLPTGALVNMAVELRFFILPPKNKGE